MFPAPQFYMLPFFTSPSMVSVNNTPPQDQIKKQNLLSILGSALKISLENFQNSEKIAETCSQSKISEQRVDEIECVNLEDSIKVDNKNKQQKIQEKKTIFTPFIISRGSRSVKNSEAAEQSRSISKQQKKKLLPKQKIIKKTEKNQRLKIGRQSIKLIDLQNRILKDKKQQKESIQTCKLPDMGFLNYKRLLSRKQSLLRRKVTNWPKIIESKKF